MVAALRAEITRRYGDTSYGGKGLRRINIVQSFDTSCIRYNEIWERECGTWYKESNVKRRFGAQPRVLSIPLYKLLLLRSNWRQNIFPSDINRIARIGSNRIIFCLLFAHFNKTAKISIWKKNTSLNLTISLTIISIREIVNVFLSYAYLIWRQSLFRRATTKDTHSVFFNKFFSLFKSRHILCFSRSIKLAA